MGERPGQVVMRGDSFCTGCEFASQYKILYGYFLHYFVVKIVWFVWGGLEMNEKVAGDVPFKNFLLATNLGRVRY